MKEQSDMERLIQKFVNKDLKPFVDSSEPAPNAAIPDQQSSAADVKVDLNKKEVLVKFNSELQPHLWTVINGTNSSGYAGPSPRNGHTAVLYQSNNLKSFTKGTDEHFVIVFGGKNADGARFNDLYILSLPYVFRFFFNIPT